MPKVKISEYSATANSNTDVASINIDEGCAPSGINNAIRAVMGHLKDFQQGTNGDPFNGPVNGTLGATTASTANVTTLTTSSTVTHNGGTANGVAYLNTSKVLTTGSALVFDGTNLVGTGKFQSQTMRIKDASYSELYFSTADTGGNGAFSYEHSTNSLRTYVNGGIKTVIDSSGNLMVGTTTAAGKVTFAGSGSASQTLTLNGTTTGANFARITSSGADAVLGVESSAGSAIMSGSSANATVLYTVGATPLQFGTNSVTRATIDTSGNLGLGASTISTVRQYIKSGGATSATWALYIDNSSASNIFNVRSDGIVTMAAYGVGTATFSAAGVISSVSDETWKIKDGIPVDPDSMLKKLEPGYWYYNNEKKEIFGTDRQLGFYAQNVNAAIGPEAAPEPEEGKPWGYYDRSVLAVTVMSLQKALATIETLTARITALEGA